MHNHTTDRSRKRYITQPNNPHPPEQLNFSSYGNCLPYNNGKFAAWYADIGENYHTNVDMQNLQNIIAYIGFNQQHIGNGQGLNSIFSTTLSLSLNNIIHTSDFVKNRLSIQKFTGDNHCFFEF